ncbi:hypothetical protein DYB34_000709 [Aphanomyces astaci]|uniref:DJ-1/PfpI domain-containing protein n=1 Tax=Aphanomyces astaci TaxID=112090 RepID=A0A3R6ZF68_APHAT|nr:hypothetical protein DYB34_000709 [Aphanomyces astaci]
MARRGIVLALTAVASGEIIFVDPVRGDDASLDGSFASPFKTIPRAQAAVRTLLVQQLAANASAPVDVVLRGGTHVLTSTLEFGPLDSGLSAAGTVTYKPYCDPLHPSDMSITPFPYVMGASTPLRYLWNGIGDANAWLGPDDPLIQLGVNPLNRTLPPKVPWPGSTDTCVDKVNVGHTCYSTTTAPCVQDCMAACQRNVDKRVYSDAVYSEFYLLFGRLGGNAIFVSGRTEYVHIALNHFTQVGATAVSIVAKSVTPGDPTHPRQFLHSRRTTVSYNQMHDYGLVTRQSAAVLVVGTSQTIVYNNLVYAIPVGGVSYSAANANAGIDSNVAQLLVRPLESPVVLAETLAPLLGGLYTTPLNLGRIDRVVYPLQAKIIGGPECAPAMGRVGALYGQQHAGCSDCCLTTQGTASIRNAPLGMSAFTLVVPVQPGNVLDIQVEGREYTRIGVYDGSEIQEAVSCLIHLSKTNADVRVFAPDILQHHVINHLTGDVMPAESRNVLVESARIARGKVEKLDLLDVAQFDAVVVPGGFGAAKNLSSFAFEGENMQVQPQVAAALTAFHSAKKPIGLICIAPVLGGKLFPGAELTMGRRSGAKWSSGPDAASAVESWGAKIIEKDHDEVHVDTVNKIVSAPAYMYDQATPAIVFDNVGQVVDAVVRMK